MNEWVNQEIKEEIKKYMETNENENTTVQITGMQQKLLEEGSLEHYRPTAGSKKNLK